MRNRQPNPEQVNEAHKRFGMCQNGDNYAKDGTGRRLPCTDHTTTPRYWQWCCEPAVWQMLGQNWKWDWVDGVLDRVPCERKLTLLACERHKQEAERTINASDFSTPEYNYSSRGFQKILKTASK